MSNQRSTKALFDYVQSRFDKALETRAQRKQAKSSAEKNVLRTKLRQPSTELNERPKNMQGRQRTVSPTPAPPSASSTLPPLPPLPELQPKKRGDDIFTPKQREPINKWEKDAVKAHCTTCFLVKVFDDKARYEGKEPIRRGLGDHGRGGDLTRKQKALLDKWKKDQAQAHCVVCFLNRVFNDMDGKTSKKKTPPKKFVLPPPDEI